LFSGTGLENAKYLKRFLKASKLNPDFFETFDSISKIKESRHFWRVIQQQNDFKDFWSRSREKFSIMLKI